MLPSTNATISISRLSSSGAPRTWTTVATEIPAYINQTREDMISGFDNQPAFLAYRMLTDGDHTAIKVGDRISDGTNTYEVRTPPAISNDLTGKHHQYLLIIQQT